MPDKHDPEIDEATRQAHRDAVDTAILSNVRIVALFAAVLYCVFSLLDHVVYPVYASLFLSLRILVSSLLILAFLSTFFRSAHRFGIWLGDVSILLGGAGILVMIYSVPDRATSDYSQGLYLVLLAMFTMNSFNVKHNLAVGLLIVGTYLWVVADGFRTDLPHVLSAGFFLISILAFVLILTEIYRRQFFRGIVKSERLRVANAELQRAQEFLHHLSMHDELTKLHNRRGFMLLAEEQLKLARRHKTGLLIFFADMDGLKNINDRHGHAMGDRAIQAIAKILQNTFRGSDIIARFAGDEFAMLSVNAAKESENVIITRLQLNLREWNKLGELPCRVDLSVGACHFEVDSGLTIETLMEKADAKLYELKRSKR